MNVESQFQLQFYHVFINSMVGGVGGALREVVDFVFIIRGKPHCSEICEMFRRLKKKLTKETTAQSIFW